MRVLHVFAGRTSAAGAVHARRVSLAFPEARHFSDLSGFEQPWQSLPLQGKPSLTRYRALAQAIASADLIIGYGEAAFDLLLAKRMFGAQLAPVVQFLEPPLETGFTARIVRALALPAAALLVAPEPIPGWAVVPVSGELPFADLRALYETALTRD